MKRLETIQEAAYLSTGNTLQYRRIMRIFFREYEKMHFQLYEREVLNLLRACPGFEEYPAQKLKQDLRMLVEWRNLIAVQELKHVRTITEYKNRQFRYSMTENAVEIERLTVKLENRYLETGNLSSCYLMRIEEALMDMKRMKSASTREAGQWWRNLQEDFQRLNQNYQDYLSEFYSGNSDKILKSVEFILHKDRLVTYLKEFVQELRVNASRMEALLKEISEEQTAEILERVVLCERDTLFPGSEDKEAVKESVRENVFGGWAALRQWFLSEAGPSECSRVLEITDEIIRKIIQNAALIVQAQSWSISRKNDYQKFIRLFMECEDLEEAHCLAAHLFGIQQVRHFRVCKDRSTESIHSSTYEEEAMEFWLRPRRRRRGSRVERTGFEDKGERKQSQRREYLKRSEEELCTVTQYIQGGCLELSKIEGKISKETRGLLLRWIETARLAGSGRGVTESGKLYQLQRTDSRCTLHCEDGDLSMPNYILMFGAREDGDI